MCCIETTGGAEQSTLVANSNACSATACSDLVCLAGVHFVLTQGELIFEKGETEKDIEVPILAAELDLHFKVVLFDAQNADLNKKRSMCDVYFAADRKVGMVMRMVHSMMFRQDVARANSNAWLEQFKEAIIPGQTWVSDPEDIAGKLQEAKASLQPIDYLLHCCSVPWKVPPLAHLACILLLNEVCLWTQTDSTKHVG
jgi:hypothetical protein